MEYAKALRYQRTEYAKKIRKQYESGDIKERRCNMREYTIRNDECSNTLSTVQKDNYIVISCAMRGRNKDGRWVQQLELNSSDFSNSITTINKDSLLLEILDKK